MRNESRFLSNALVYVVDKSKKETEASLRDLSEHGLSIKSEDYINIEPNSSYVVAVIPEREAQVGKFELEIESKWVKLNKLQMESGFSVVVSFDEAEFKNYLEFLNQKDRIDLPPSDRARTAGRASPVVSSTAVDLTPASSDDVDVEKGENSPPSDTGSPEDKGNT